MDLIGRWKRGYGSNREMEISVRTATLSPTPLTVSVASTNIPVFSD